MNIYLSSDHPNKKLQRLDMAQYVSATHHIWNAPEHFDAIRVYIHRPTAPKSYFMTNGILLRSGAWKVRIEAGMLPDIGETTYEVFGVENPGESERREFLGSGEISISARCADGSQASVMTVPERVVIYDEEGAAHYLTAVPDGMGNFTSVVD